MVGDTFNSKFVVCAGCLAMTEDQRPTTDAIIVIDIIHEEAAMRTIEGEIWIGNELTRILINTFRLWFNYLQKIISFTSSQLVPFSRRFVDALFMMFHFMDDCVCGFDWSCEFAVQRQDLLGVESWLNTEYSLFIYESNAGTGPLIFGCL